ncbi:MAG TPA: alkaline phosphatase family protein [Polyangiaceae bacterium]|nr:alkaline phosphatase family protein [Polyangiaceae bacterium]
MQRFPTLRLPAPRATVKPNTRNSIQLLLCASALLFACDGGHQAASSSESDSGHHTSAPSKSDGGPHTSASDSDAGHYADASGAWDGSRAGSKPIEHVLLLSIDGFHERDLTRYVNDKPDSTLARLLAVGAHYSNVRAPFPSDSFPSVLAWATGGTPRSTGVFYDISFDRSLAAPDSDCSVRGTVVDFSEVVDVDASRLDGGGINPHALPRDPDRKCAPVYPHDYLRTNTIFEVLHEASKRTAWSDKHLSYEILNGPSGVGVDDAFNPEIAAIDSKALSSVKDYDDSKVQALIQQIHGLDHAGAAASVPAFFGMNFQAVSTMQKVFGYVDSSGAPSDTLASAIDGVDASLGTLVDQLYAAKLWDSTLLVITASHGQSPIDPALTQRLSPSTIPDLVEQLSPGLLSAITQDAVALLWLSDSSRAGDVAQTLGDHADLAGIDHVLYGKDLSQMFGDAGDSRIPDVVVVVKDGTIYTDSGKKIAEHGGDSDDDRHVALLVVGGADVPVERDDALETRQIAPTVLEALGLSAASLKALTLEPAKALPGLGF